jgi:hypothetical protein
MSCRAVFDDLPTRIVVVVDGPHPPVELVTIAATPKPVVLAERALHVPIASGSGGHSRTTAVGVKLC